MAKVFCFLDRLSSVWRYDFGDALTLPGGRRLIGTTTFPEVEILFQVLQGVRTHLTGESSRGYLLRLGMPRKHQDALVEFAPIMRLPAGAHVRHEAKGFGPANTTLDWIIESNSVILGLEVKNRTADLLDSMTRLDAGELSP
ncbi:MAG TPA: hypothetical protein VGJ18_09425, partial [Gemmatimonadaceae bacterium]